MSKPRIPISAMLSLALSLPFLPHPLLAQSRSAQTQAAEANAAKAAASRPEEQLHVTTILANARLIDGTGAPPRDHVTVSLRDNIIVNIAPATADLPASSEDTRVIDCAGKTIIPGLIDAHAHLGVLLANATPSPDAYTRENVVAALDQFARYGVTTIMSLGVNRDLVYTLRSEGEAAAEAGTLTGATLFTAGRGIGVPDGAPPLAVAPDQVYRPASPAEARQEVDELARQHADIVKIWVDNLHGKVPSMNPEIYRAVIDQAHRQHLRVAAHVYAFQDARQLVADGVDVLAHSIRDTSLNRIKDRSFISAMKGHGTWYIPTFTVDEAFFIYAQKPSLLTSDFFKEAAGPALLAKLTAPDYAAKIAADPSTVQHQKDLANGRKNFALLYHAGVHVAFGTDAGAMPGRIPGFSEHRELEDMVAAGLTPLEAITVATGRTAALFQTLNNRAARLGTITPGNTADLILLSADPSVNIRNTRHIVTVFHNGLPLPGPPPPD